MEFLREELRQSVYRSRFLELLECLDRNASWDKWRPVSGHPSLGAMYLGLWVPGVMKTKAVNRLPLQMEISRGIPQG